VATFIITAKILMPAPKYLKKLAREWAFEHGHRALSDDARFRQAYFRLPLRLVQSLKPSELPKINIDIKYKHLTKLYDKRAEALAKDILIQEPDDFVPASIRLGERTIKVKLRLKGDQTEHLKGKKWSFRVRVRGKDQIFGMRRFSIQNPKVRGYHAELLFQETLRDLGVLVPRYFFVDVVVNGDDVGIMALEEHFSKELLESNGRREGVIVRFDESLVWEANDGFSGGWCGAFDSYLNAPIDAFQSAKVRKSVRLGNEYAIAVGILRGFNGGFMQASEVFDAELLGKYLAVAELWGAKHAVRWHNLRLYLNPISLRLEPISFDADLRKNFDKFNKNLVVAQQEPMVIAILKDPKIFKVYRETIQMLAREILAGGRLQEKLEIAEQKYLADLRREFYLLEKYPRNKLKERAKYLLTLGENSFSEDKKTTQSSPTLIHVNTIRGSNGRPILELENTIPYGVEVVPVKLYGFMEDKKPTEGFPTLIHAYTIKDTNGPYLELANAIPHDVEVVSINWIANGKAPSIEFQVLSNQSFPMSLPPTPLGSQPKTNPIYYSPPPDEALYSIEVTARIQEQKQRHKIIAKPYYHLLKSNPVPDSTLHEQLSRHPFLTYNKKENCLVVQRGLWEVAGSLVIPTGITLKIQAGATLRFLSGEGLFSHGPMELLGTKDDPIILEGIPSKADKNFWQGVAVLSANSPSVWAYVTIRDTTGISYKGWQLTGGATFYQSDIRMNRCRFLGNLGEDALNIFHSKFVLDGVEILETVSDGLDVDFSDGIIKDGIFQSIGKAGGGDAIDISGSDVRVTGSHLLDISDKALSVGEQSKMVAQKLIIEDVGTGAASKDGSHLEISDSSIKNAHHTGLMAYIKKAEFGSAQIEANKINFLETSSEARVQRGSSITLNGKKIESEDIEVEALYKTIMKPGLRR
jgi:hypothetical protein